MPDEEPTESASRPRATSELDDSALVARARAGDRAAFGEVVRRHHAGAIRLATAIAGSWHHNEEVNDIVQDAFVSAYQSLDSYRAESPLRPWLMRIVANQAKNHLRSRHRRLRTNQRASALRADTPVSPLDCVVAADRSERLLAAVRVLPEPERDVVAMRYFAGLSEAETAAGLGVPAGTVKSRMARAMDRLRANLGEGDR
jgi:RNA polymerase sigma-70 factor (ECF subfamily)